MSGSWKLQQNPSQENKVSSSNLVEIKKLHSILKSATEQLELCSIGYDDAWRELVKCKGVLKPQTCPCSCTCTCKPCNDIDSCLRQLESNIQEANLDHHIILNQLKEVLVQWLWLTDRTNLPMLKIGIFENQFSPHTLYMFINIMILSNKHVMG